jgi:23S rRNA pseudouridine1911/1915/1917 synthase
VRFVVRPEEAGQRLDKLLVRHAPGVGRRQVARLFAEGAVLVGGHPAHKGERAVAGVEVELGALPNDAPEPEMNAPLGVRLERPDLLMVSKPAGQPTAALRGSTRGTLVAALIGRYPELAYVGTVREPGIIHRLDTQTSGLVVVARTAEAFTTLRAALRAGELDKRYLAITESAELPGSGVVELEIAPHPGDARRVVVGERALASRGARPARTEWHVVRRSGRFALIEARAARAARHQIRAHLAAIGHAIAGDALYGGPQVPGLGERHALHASYAAWAGDATRAGFAVEDPLPPDLAILLG